MNPLWLLPFAIVLLALGTFFGALWVLKQYDRWLARRAARRAGWWS